MPVVSVGNLVMGGSGKTPFTIYLAELLLERGFKPAVVSRGYRGTNRERFLVVGDGSSGEPLVGPSKSGDEPFLMAKRLPNVPVLIGRRRIDAIEAAKRLFACNIAVLDDGFQHLSLQRDADIALLNGTEDSMFPLGSLREPISALNRADIVVLMGSSEMTKYSALHYADTSSVFRCHLLPISLGKNIRKQAHLSPSEYAGREVVLVSGIANPGRFRATAEDLDWQVVDQLIYPDHYVFSDAELREILVQYHDIPIVVTEKDWVKLPEWFKNESQVLVLRIHVVIEDEEAFWAALRRFIP